MILIFSIEKLNKYICIFFLLTWTIISSLIRAEVLDLTFCNEKHIGMDTETTCRITLKTIQGN